MSQKRNFPYQDEEPWDAEKALNERRELFRSAEERLRKPMTNSQTAQVLQRRQPVQRKKHRKKKTNFKGWLILGVIAAVILAILIGLIVLIVSLFEPDEESQPTLPSASAEVSEEQQSDPLALTLEKAESLAVRYDYDAAIATLAEFGENWQEQPELMQAQERYLQLQAALVRWEDVTAIPHISFRALIVDAERAFDGDANAQNYNQSMITVNEFRAILQELYDNDFVLIKMHDMVKTVETSDGATEFEPGEIYLPEGKKPIILSQEDLNYHASRVDGSDEDNLPDAEGDGFACQLLLDENGLPTCKYIDAEGNELYGAYDFVPILEEFVTQHPDFSYRGAKGVISVTGTDGVFGFQTHPDFELELGKDAYMQQIRQAQALVAVLKENGWEIACHGYSKISFSDKSADAIKTNIERWEYEVQPVVGKTDILIYPNGSDIGGVDYYSGSKFNVLYDAGYRFFCHMDSSEHWVQLRSNYMRQARRMIDGYRLEYGEELLDDLFQVDQVIGKERPRPVPSYG